MALKTKKAVAKRFHMRANGTILRGSAKMRHNLRRRSKDAKRQSKNPVVIAQSCEKLINRCAPYGL